MPEELEKSLKRTASKKGYKDERADAYVYGTLNKLGYMHGNTKLKRKKKLRR